MKQNTKIKMETNKGDIVIELFNDNAPKTVENFVKLVNKGFYNGTKFHRIIPNFMIQGGCPEGSGMGGPGYKIKFEINKELKHRKYMLSMAHAGKNTGGSQFFITTAPTPWLDGVHTIFGKVVEGFGVVDLIGHLGSGSGHPKEIVIVQNISII